MNTEPTMTAKMTDITMHRTLALLALLSALTVSAMLIVALQAGISQEPFQVARLADANTAKLLLNPAGLRLNVGLDNLFIILYTSYFLLLSIRFRSLIDPLHAGVALGALLITALLDAAENHHILMMLFSAEHSLPLSVAESQWQMAASSVKFHSSYVALVLFAFGFRLWGGLGRVIAWGVWLVYLPLGLLIFMTPPEVVRPLVIGRTLFFILAFVLSAILFRTAPRQPH